MSVMKKPGDRTARSSKMWLLALAAPLTLMLAAAPAMAQAAPAAASDDNANYEVVVGVGKTQVIQLPTPYTDVLIGDPKIADVMPLSGHSVYVVGKSMGSTALTLYGPGKRLIAAVSVLVSPDLEALKNRLHDVLPDEHDISVSAANDSILLSGTAGSPNALQQAATLANAFAPGKVVNMLGVQGTQQVMLSVRFVEMERSTANNLQLDVTTPPGLSTTHSNTQIGTGAFNTNAFSNTFGSIFTRIATGSGNLELELDALETKGLVKTLAEPNLVAMSGDTASFLAGGEFPIPVSGTPATSATPYATITVDYKQFGISLAFTPTILKDGLVNLVINPEVSSIDPSSAINTGIVSIPGFKVRRAHTTVELRDGESFTIAGLLSDNYQNNIRQFPWIGDVPVLGALFRSTNFQHDESELVIVVTPHLVTPQRTTPATPADHFIPPSDFELFLLGAMRGAPENLAPEDRALMTADPAKGGVDGPHGHVLY
jgi:pilus assembly protein CpaC